MNLNPRQDFRGSAHAKTWNDVVDSEQFRAAAKAAFLQFSMSQPAPSSPELEGARKFLERLMSLCEEPPKATASTLSPQLART